MRASFCPSCGKQVGVEDRFCRSCGASLHEPEGLDDAPPRVLEIQALCRTITWPAVRQLAEARSRVWSEKEPTSTGGQDPNLMQRLDQWMRWWHPIERDLYVHIASDAFECGWAAAMTHAPPVDWYSGWRTGWSKFWEATGLPVVAPHPERSEGLRIISETPEYPHSSVCVSWAVGWCLGLAAREGVIKADAASRAFSRTDQGLFKERSLDIQAMKEAAAYGRTGKPASMLLDPHRSFEVGGIAWWVSAWHQTLQAAAQVAFGYRKDTMQVPIGESRLAWAIALVPANDPIAALRHKAEVNSLKEEAKACGIVALASETVSDAAQITMHAMSYLSGSRDSRSLSAYRAFTSVGARFRPT